MSIPTDAEILLASFIWGFSIATNIFTAVNEIRQTTTSWKHLKRASACIVMIWVEWLAILTQGDSLPT
ncbi:hypothetical protein DER44DRAFT_123521 [Fusarium oxysporum]|nr:hypothetical protein DER44DRAFT_123521 [Fusarium oxysporum]